MACLLTSTRERSPALPTGLLNWFGRFWSIPDTYALNHQSFDAYLFLRLLKMFVVIAFVGCCITWPVLFPVNATGGGGLVQLNVLTFGNILTPKHSSRLYAHTFVGWLYFGFIMYTIARESVFYINLRQAFLLSPLYANRISSRTVLFTAVPEPYRDEAMLRKVYGASVKAVWISTHSKELDELVEERDKTAYKLEAAEVKLVKAANGERLKALKKEGDSREDEAPMGDRDGGESGSAAARWIPQKKRPSHKLKFLVGKKVDTINWCREELSHSVPKVEAMQAEIRAGSGTTIPSVFIEFHTQSEAQAAFQSLAHHQALHMSPRYIGVQPDEIVWRSLRMKWWELVIRRFAVQGFIAALIIFWAIPVAFVGFISNIPALEHKYSWLHFLTYVPSQIMGVISGLLPSVLLSVLMSLVPIIMRGEFSTSHRGRRPD